MADTKISALPAATTPLAGTEVLPIVQGGTTDKVSVANLTAGRSVSTADLYAIKTSAGAVVDVLTVQNLNSTNGTEAAIFFAPTSATGNIRGARVSSINDGSNGVGLKFYTGSGASITNKLSIGSDANVIIQSGNLLFGTASKSIIDSTNTVQATFSSTDVNFQGGNVKIGTAAKGINFTANTPAAGKTSQLLNWYEEGTWTPGQGSGLTVVGTFASSGKYTRIGRMVVVKGVLTATTSLTWASGGAEVTKDLPFATEAEYPASAFNGAYNATAALLASNTQVYSVEAMAATNQVTFCVTYFV